MPSNHDKLIAFLRNPPKRIGDKAIKKRKRRIGRALGGFKGEMFKRQKGRCKYCKAPMLFDDPNHDRFATVDHVLPMARGGDSRRSNLVLACRRCNCAKGAMTVDEFRAAQGIEAGTGETRSGSIPKDESPVAKRCARMSGDTPKPGRADM